MKSPFDKTLFLLCMVAVLAACSAGSSNADATSVEEGDDYVLKHVQMYRILGPQGDTSVWIDYFHNGINSTHLDSLIDSGKVCVNDLILTELVPSVRHRKEKEFLPLKLFEG